jgi:methionine synthase II (cobalamin-independent)
MKSQDQILTTHVGSLIRPPALVDLLVRESRGEQVDPKAVRASIDQEVPRIVRQQVETGIDIVNDGEFGKALSWTHYIAARLTGVEVRPEVLPEFVKAGPVKIARILRNSTPSTRTSMGRPAWARRRLEA